MTEPTDHPDPDLLAAFGRGEVGPADAALVEAHLEACDDCRSALEAASADDPLVDLVRAAGLKAEPTPPPPAVPTGYTLESVLGRGGMGVVHRARQEGLGRTVALKRIAAGADASPSELARFRAEAEAAASLRHPNIVPIYDVGVIDGSPFYAMELMEGGSLSDRLADGPMPAARAAALTATLARAIEHAHGRGVVHRDLKPHNVLFDADGRPKVADFGLAKRLGARAVTGSGALLGTPSYMAPEQASGLADAVGPAADVYALGVVLFECLTGRPPFLAPSPVETLDLVRLSEPPAPGRLQPGVPRDVQTICLTCLEKQPSRRYASAAALADDLDRFARGEPILARPVGPAGRLAKWARRRPSQAALAALAIVAAAGAVAGALVHDARLRAALGQAEESAAEARRQRASAESNYRDARETLGRLVGAFEEPRFRNVPRLGELMRVQLEAALGFYDHALARADAGDPVVRLDTAQAAIEAANLQIVLGRRADAEANLLRARRLLEALVREAPDDPAPARSLMVEHLKLGVMLMETDNGRSIAELEAALAIADRRVDASWVGRHDVAWCLHNLGSAYQIAGKGDLAEAPLARAAGLLEELLRERPDEPKIQASTAQTYINLANGRAAAGDVDRAEADFARAQGLLERAIAADAENPEPAADLCDLAVNRGNLLARSGRVDQAIALLTSGLERIAPLLRENPASSRLNQTLQNLHGARAQAFEKSGRFAEALPDWDRVVEILPDRPGRMGLRFIRLLCLARAGMVDRVRAEAAAILDHPDEPLTPADRYNVACAFCLAASTPDVAEEARKLLLDDALGHLARSFADDPSLRANAQADADLAPLAGAEGFRKLVEGR